MDDGIYLDMSFETYLAEPRVSSSDLTNYMEGPSAYWARSWMNPDALEREETDAMTLGSAYHCARLEPEKFDGLYCEELVPEDIEGTLLSNSTQIGERLAELGEPKKKAGEKVEDQAARLLAADPDAKIWIVERARWEAEIKGDRTAIAPKYWAEILRDQKRLRDNPEISRIISGGVAEVSIFWTDPETGLKCKCRPDYLGKDFITHLKTWDARSRGKTANKSILDSFMWDGHYRTSWFYLRGLEAMKDLEVQDGKLAPDLAKAWRDQPGMWSNWFLFVRRSGIPDIRARRVTFFRMPAGVDPQAIGASKERFTLTPSALAMKADLEVKACLRGILDGIEIYGTDGAPWYPRDMIADLEDEDFSPYWLDSMSEPR